MKICIDPGHGGKFPGAVSEDGRHLEKDNTLSIARAIHGKEPNLPGVQLAYTRLEDKHLGDAQLEDLAARVEFANAAGAELFVSIHQNADVQRRGYGAETYYYGIGDHWQDSGGHHDGHCSIPGHPVWPGAGLGPAGGN